MIPSTITQESLDILNNMLTLIPQSGKFSIEDIHAKYFLKPTYIKTGENLQAYDRVRNDLTKRDVYNNIVSFLLKMGMATATGDSYPFVQLELTNIGRTVRAYKDVKTFFVEERKVYSRSELIDELNSKIASIPDYGEFEFAIKYADYIIFQASDFIGLSEAEAKAKKEDIIEQNQFLRVSHQEMVKNERVVQFLIDGGFAVNRHDIKVPGKIYRQLTDKGRELKEAGSMDNYLQKISAIEREKREEASYRIVERRRNSYMFWITISIAIATVFQGIFNALEAIRNYYNPLLPVAIWGLGIFTGFFIVFIFVIVISQLIMRRKQPNTSTSSTAATEGS